MAQMDFSMYGNLPKPADPLDTVGKWVGVKNQLQTNELLQGQTEGVGISNRANQQDLQQKSLNNAGAILGGWILSNPDRTINRDTAIEWVHQLVRMGVIQPGQETEMIRAGATSKGGYKDYFMSLYGAFVTSAGGAWPAGPAIPGEGGQGPQPTLQAPATAAARAAGTLDEGEPSPEEVPPGEAPATGRPAPAPKRRTGGVAASGAPLGAETAATKTAGGAADVYTASQAALTALPTTQGQLDNILQEASQMTTGASTEEINRFTSAFNRIFGTNINADQIAAGNALDKTVKQMALSFANQMGMSETSLLTAIGATPNSDMSNLGIEKATAFMKGMIEAMRARGNYLGAIADRDGSSADFYKASREFARNFDLRVYQYPFMNPADQQAMLGQIQARKGGLDDFRKKINWALQNGLISAPGGE